MYRGGEHKQWSCGKAGTVNLQKVSSIGRDIGDPCFFQSSTKVIITLNRMLKPDKWRATFDSEGRAFGFKKALKLIVLGGVDPSIRPEVWEFLLGCYALGSTAEYRRRLRIVRRERYSDLIKQCQTMNSSIGTGSLAHVTGSKVIDMRTLSNDDQKMETKIEGSTSVDNKTEVGKSCNRGSTCTEVANAGQWERSNGCVDLVSLRASTDNAAYYSSGPQNCSSPKLGREADGSCYATDSCFDFSPLPVANLYEKSGKDKNFCTRHGNKLSAQQKLRFEDDRMHSFQISNNADLVIESNGQQSPATLHPNDWEIEVASPDEDKAEIMSDNLVNELQMVNQRRISDVPQIAMISTTISQGRPVSEDRVSEWLCTLHRIVVDVVRTDSHLEFYEDAKNLARMSDILAVYAWVDPATGYCQGMSDLLSPFVVLFEDNADAFWCFEMLLRRMRENFQMEGPIGVMKQLQALWHILELTDREMFAHLSNIGAESLHFAFPMLLVLFRRELSFDEALSMWERMWAADFDESLVYYLQEKCLEALVLHLPKDPEEETREGNGHTNEGRRKVGSHQNGNGIKNDVLQSNHENVDHSIRDVKLKLRSSHSLCGFIKFRWPRNGCVQMSTVASVTRKGNYELPIFCVAAIIVTNRQKIIRETHSFDDMIKIFNDKMLKIKVKRCIQVAVKLRKKYFYKVIRRKSRAAQKGTRVIPLSTCCCGKSTEWH